MSMRILQISDTHLVAQGGDAEGHDHLTDVLERLSDVGPLDAIVVAGDCADDGAVASYEALWAAVDAFAAAHGARVVYAMGNHDDRANFARVLGDGHGGTASGDQPINGVTWLGETRVITVDSTIPHRPDGILTAETLAWLREELRAPAPDGTVLVVHHPPVPPVVALFTAMSLANPQNVADVLAGSDVRVVLSAHYHHHLAAELLAGERRIPVVVSPGVSGVFDTFAAPGSTRMLDAYGAVLLDLDADGVRHCIVAGGSHVVTKQRSVEEVQARVEAYRRRLNPSTPGQ